MDDLREELVTLGQMIMFAEVQREDAIAQLADLWRTHQRRLSVDDLAQWTAVPQDLLRTLAPSPDPDADAGLP